MHYHETLKTVQFLPRWGHLTHQLNIKSRMKFCHRINFSAFHKRAYARKYKVPRRSYTKKSFCGKEYQLQVVEVEAIQQLYTKKRKKEKPVWGCDVRIALNSFFSTQFDRNFCRVKTYTRSADSENQFKSVKRRIRRLSLLFCKGNSFRNEQI